jgi:hypothetical protein
MTAYKVLRPGALAKIALETHPDWSDRRLAREYGISEMTIGRERKSLATNVTPESRRVGRDGKSYSPSRETAPASNVAPESPATSLAPESRRNARTLELAFEQRVQAECKRCVEEYILPAYRKDLVDAADILRSRKGILPLAMFKKILSCLHPDRVGPELQQRYQDAFTAFKALERVIVAEAEIPTPEVDFPRTWAEMKAREQAKKTRKRTGNVVHAGLPVAGGLHAR